jgi:hypothetical protein
MGHNRYNSAWVCQRDGVCRCERVYVGMRAVWRGAAILATVRCPVGSGRSRQGYYCKVLVEKSSPLEPVDSFQVGSWKGLSQNVFLRSVSRKAVIKFEAKSFCMSLCPSVSVPVSFFLVLRYVSSGRMFGRSLKSLNRSKRADRYDLKVL